jgi:hypothetical protein
VISLLCQMNETCKAATQINNTHDNKKKHVNTIENKHMLSTKNESHNRNTIQCNLKKNKHTNKKCV